MSTMSNKSTKNRPVKNYGCFALAGDAVLSFAGWRLVLTEEHAQVSLAQPSGKVRRVALRSTRRAAWREGDEHVVTEKSRGK